MTADSDNFTSNIGQLDGANSIGDSSITSSKSSSDVEDESFSDTEIDSDEEIEPDLTPIQLTPTKKTKVSRCLFSSTHNIDECTKPLQ